MADELFFNPWKSRRGVKSRQTPARAPFDPLQPYLGSAWLCFAGISRGGFT